MGCCVVVKEIREEDDGEGQILQENPGSIHIEKLIFYLVNLLEQDNFSNTLKSCKTVVG